MNDQAIERATRQLAEAGVLPYEEVLRLLRAVEAADIASRNPCHCQRIPWKPHLHRFDLRRVAA